MSIYLFYCSRHCAGQLCCTMLDSGLLKQASLSDIGLLSCLHENRNVVSDSTVRAIFKKCVKNILLIVNRKSGNGAEYRDLQIQRLSSKLCLVECSLAVKTIQNINMRACPKALLAGSFNFVTFGIERIHRNDDSSTVWTCESIVFIRSYNSSKKCRSHLRKTQI